MKNLATTHWGCSSGYRRALVLFAFPLRWSASELNQSVSFHGTECVKGIYSRLPRTHAFARSSVKSAVGFHHLHLELHKRPVTVSGHHQDFLLEQEESENVLAKLIDKFCGPMERIAL